MADNPYLDLALEVAINRYNLDEMEWGMTSFSESSKTISVGLTDGETKMKITFDREDIRFEEMKRWTEERKLAYVKHLLENGEELPPSLVDSFHEVMMKLDIPANKDDEEQSVIVEVETDKEKSFGLEETPEEFEEKVEGKKAKKFKRKKVSA